MAKHFWRQGSLCSEGSGAADLQAWWRPLFSAFIGCGKGVSFSRSFVEESKEVKKLLQGAELIEPGALAGEAFVTFVVVLQFPQTCCLLFQVASTLVSPRETQLDMSRGHSEW